MTYLDNVAKLLEVLWHREEATCQAISNDGRRCTNESTLFVDTIDATNQTVTFWLGCDIHTHSSDFHPYMQKSDPVVYN